MVVHMRLDPYIYFLLINKKLDQFTLSAARDILLEEGETNMDAAQARRYVYVHLRRLINQGLIEKRVMPRRRDNIYVKTDVFNHFTYKSGVLRRAKNGMSMHIPPESADHVDESMLSKTQSPKSEMVEMVSSCDGEKLKQLEKENFFLRKLVVDLSLQKEILQNHIGNQVPN